MDKNQGKTNKFYDQWQVAFYKMFIPYVSHIWGGKPNNFFCKTLFIYKGKSKGSDMTPV